jgi:hypothetical protein
MAIAVECAICLENLFAPKTLVCGHIFCSGCVQQLQDKICPLCRAALDPPCPQEWKSAMTTCKSCEETMTIEKSQTHTCACLLNFTVIYKNSKREQRVPCNARVCSWSKGEPSVLLDGKMRFCLDGTAQFCLGVSLFTCSLRLWVLHKDGSMSHFKGIETKMDLPQNDDLEACRVFLLRWAACPRETTDKFPILRWEKEKS